MRLNLLLVTMFAFGCGGSKQASTTDSVASAGESETVAILTVDERVARAAALLTTGKEADATLAVSELRPLLIEAPERADIPYNLGLAYHQLDDGLNARKYYLRSTAVEPSLGAAWLNLGALAEQGGQYRRALQHYRAGMQNDPDTPQLVVGTIGVLRRMGRHDEAIREGKAALSRDANNIDVYNNLGLVYIDQGKPDLAQFIYQKALNTIDGADNNPTLHANLGRAFLEKDRPYNAKKELEKALELDPDLVAAMLYLADLAMDDRDWGETVELLEKAALLEPASGSIQMNLGIAYRGLGDLERSRQAYENALRLEPENPDPYINIGLLLGQHENDFDGGIAAIQQYRTRGGDHSARADELLVSFQNRKEKFEEEEARQAKRDADRKKREEESRLAAEYEAMQAKWRKEQEEKAAAEEEAKRRAEAAAAAALGAAPVPAPQPEPVERQAPPAEVPASPSVPTEPAGVWGAAPTAPTVPAAPSSLATPEPTPPPPPVAPATPPVVQPPAEAAPPPPPAGVWGGASEPAPEIQVPEPVRGTRQVGAPCASDNQCIEGLVCGGGVCTGKGSSPAPAATRGTRQVGAPCSTDNQCVEGLSCTNNACAGEQSGGGEGSWGGW